MQREDQPSVRQSTHFLRVAAVHATNKNKWSAIWNAAQTSCVLTEGVGCSTACCLGGGGLYYLPSFKFIFGDACVRVSDAAPF